MYYVNIFKGLQVYGGSWNVKDSRSFDQEEIDAVKSAQIVSSEFGKSVCFIMKSGGSTYIPLSNDSNLEVGDNVDLTTAKVLTLQRDGNADINRIQA